jgi:polysaccharide chain length determinant protein (PEP-CTERM system associated)
MSQEEITATPMTFREAVEIFLRRRWLFGGGLFACWLLVWSASWLLPAVYCSESVILVEQQKVPEEYVVANVTLDLQQRLEAMRQQILSRTRLQRIIDQYQLYRGGHSNPDEVIEQMRKDVKTELVEAPGHRGQLSAFKISYSAPSAGLAQQVNAQLTSLFVDQNIQEQSQRSENTTEFLSTELETARQGLAQQEAKVKQFKMGNLGRLPSQMDGNVHILSGLQERQHNLSQSLNRAQEQRLYLQSLLAQYRSVKAEGEHGANTLPGIEEQLARLKQELAADQAKYTPNHPDIVRLKRLLARTEKQEEDIKARLAAGGNDSAQSAIVSHDLSANSPMLQLDGQLKANQQEIENTRRELQLVDNQIASYQGRLNETPITEQQLADLTRDYEQSKANYDSLLKKQMQSQLATNLEKRQEGEQFRIIDPASLPIKPVSPDRLKMSLMGVLGGLVLGIGLAVLFELLDDRVRKEDEIAQIVNARILAGIPHLSTPQELKKQHVRRVLEWSGASLMLLLLLAGNAFTFLRG